DTITDFSAAQGDRIDLSQIDANTTVGGNQDFTFLGTAAFTGHAGELRETAVAGGYLVSGDLNGDGVSDFQLMVNTSAALHADSFFL
ncbi:type I secretion C-terminal target domain-containing protein, partial [Xanthobacter autotrophicus]|uniref:type I secretion C-terminal target domain-containing protein n=1 Tax=Xanthobacter autotrophicus TaxID=280 RepID=UPI00372CBAA6